MDEQMRNLGIDRGMLGLISKYWRVMLLRGVFAILFGIIAIVWPGRTLLGLVWLFGVYAIGDGAVEIWSGFQNRNRHDRWWVEILIGLAGIVAGVLVIAWPGLSTLALMYFIAAWMLVMGVFQVVYAIRVRKEIANELWIILSGVLSVALGLYFMAFPGDGAISLIWLIGIYALFFGALLSRFPLVGAELVDFTAGRPDVLATVDIGQAPLTVIVGHPRPQILRRGRVLFRLPSLRQILGLGRLAVDHAPAMLIGDFNMGPRHPGYRRLQRLGLVDAFAFAGSGQGRTFPIRLGVPGSGAEQGRQRTFRTLALKRFDHIWCTPDLTPERAWIGPDTGSDHASVVARIRLPPNHG